MSQFPYVVRITDSAIESTNFNNLFDTIPEDLTFF